MPDVDNNFGGSLGLDFRKWWRHVQTKNIGEKVEKPSGSVVSQSISRGLVTRFENFSKLVTKPLIFDCAPYNRRICALYGQSVDL